MFEPFAIINKRPHILDCRIMSNLQTLFSEAIHLHQQGLLEEAIAKYQAILQSLPVNVNVLGNLGLACRDLGDLSAALRYCRRAADAAPDDSSQQLNLGAVYESMDQPDDARNCYQKALTLTPGNPKALNNLGKLLHMQGNTEQGLKLIRESVAIEPNSPLALNNLGVILSSLGQIKTAIKYTERSLSLAPRHPETLYNLAGLYNCEERYPEAAQLLERLLELQSDHESARHMLAAARGKVTNAAPKQYIVETFDKYAHKFDHHLTESLGYDAPETLATMTREFLATNEHSSFTRGIDLGCGTGLSGAAFSPLTASLTGVDLSPLMLEQAREKNLYQQLECQEVIEFLQGDRNCYDLFIATDVLIYIGNLEPFFAAIQARSENCSIIACSIERLEGDGEYKLCTSGRYAHSRDYLTTQAEKFGFTCVAHRDHTIRKENGKWIVGDLFLLQIK